MTITPDDSIAASKTMPPSTFEQPVASSSSQASTTMADEAPEDAVEVFDPHPTFAYTGTLRPAYPLTKNKKVPAHIVRPNYAREEVRQWFWSFWWDVSAL